MDWNEFCQKISAIFAPWKRQLLLDINIDKIEYTIASEKYIYTAEEYSVLMKSAERYTFMAYSIYDEKSFESVVDLLEVDSRRHFSIGLEDKLNDIIISDEDSKITYSFKEVSNELIWYIIKDYNATLKTFSRFPHYLFERKCEGLSNKDLFSVFRIATRMPFAVHIDSVSQIRRELLEGHAKSFLFNFAYNFDFVFKIVTEVDELFPPREFIRMSRINNIDEITAPQLLYKQELVEQYYMALASEDPFVKFIGFYHIMENFYEEVYNEDIFINVQHFIQHPGFSSKRKKDIVKIVDLIKKKTKQSKEEFQGSELEALELTLKKFVNMSELVNYFDEHKNSYIDYYKTKEIGFSNGDAVDLRDISNEKLFKKLAARIYKTRNALVHSKSNENRINERGLYKPFKDSKELSKEIPLMRYISEEILINSASEL